MERKGEGEWKYTSPLLQSYFDHTPKSLFLTENVSFPPINFAFSAKIKDATTLQKLYLSIFSSTPC